MPSVTPSVRKASPSPDSSGIPNKASPFSESSTTGSASSVGKASHLEGFEGSESDDESLDEGVEEGVVDPEGAGWVLWVWALV